MELAELLTRLDMLLDASSNENIVPDFVGHIHLFVLLMSFDV